MSSFFRSALDSSSSTEDSSTSSNDAEPKPHEHDALFKVHTLDSDDNTRRGSVDSNGALATRGRGPSKTHIPPSADPVRRNDRSYHKDMILHALLEDKCLREALEELNGQSDLGVRYTVDHPEVKKLAHAKYQYVSTHLGAHSLVAPGLHGEELTDVRHAYLQGLHYLSSRTQSKDGVIGLRSRPASDKALSSAVRKLLVSPPASRALSPTHPDPADSASKGTAPVGANFASAVLPSVLHPLVNHPMLDITRYMRDYVELACVGKGGYGRVYHAQHKLDGSHYAIKKIAISPLRMRRIQLRGQMELDSLLTELRTLARLDHPNIVRYYGGWLEYSTSEDSASRPVLSNRVKSFLIEAPATITTTMTSTDSVITEVSNPLDDDIVFEDSLPMASTQGDRHDAIMNTASTGQIHLRAPPHPAKRRTSSMVSHRSTVESVSDEDSEVEFVPRNEPESALLSLSHEDEASSEPSRIGPHLTLHIQMSLHPLSLAEYLSPDALQDSLEFKHCFHAGMALRIMLAVLDGVEYLHEQGIVHRDLKPANIFLTIYDKRLRPPGCVDLASCQDCHSTPGNSSGSSSDEYYKPKYLNIRIGDFGLVAAIARPDSDPAAQPMSKAVGTEFYRPPVASDVVSEKLDVFALGVITFELLWKFKTRMERHETLSELKKGNLPDGFASSVGVAGHQLEGCIRGMLCRNEYQRLTCAEVRRIIESIV